MLKDSKQLQTRNLKNLALETPFKEIDTPIGKQVIPVKWAFKYKLNSDGYLIKYKARLVVRGDLLLMTFEDTRATTLAARVLRRAPLLWQRELGKILTKLRL